MRVAGIYCAASRLAPAVETGPDVLYIHNVLGAVRCHGFLSFCIGVVWPYWYISRDMEGWGLVRCKVRLHEGTKLRARVLLRDTLYNKE